MQDARGTWSGTSLFKYTSPIRPRTKETNQPSSISLWRSSVGAKSNVMTTTATSLATTKLICSAHTQHACSHRHAGHSVRQGCQISATAKLGARRSMRREASAAGPHAAPPGT
jgi:hypothetical protein